MPSVLHATGDRLVFKALKDTLSAFTQYTPLALSTALRCAMPQTMNCLSVPCNVLCPMRAKRHHTCRQYHACPSTRGMACSSLARRPIMSGSLCMQGAILHALPPQHAAQEPFLHNMQRGSPFLHNMQRSSRNTGPDISSSGVPGWSRMTASTNDIETQQTLNQPYASRKGMDVRSSNTASTVRLSQTLLNLRVQQARGRLIQHHCVHGHAEPLRPTGRARRHDRAHLRARCGLR